MTGTDLAVMFRRGSPRLRRGTERNLAKFHDDIDESLFGRAQTVTIEAFGHTWLNYPAGLAEDLVTLEREGAVYSHFADPGSEQPDGTATFSYYRIPLLP